MQLASVHSCDLERLHGQDFFFFFPPQLNSPWRFSCCLCPCPACSSTTATIKEGCATPHTPASVERRKLSFYSFIFMFVVQGYPPLWLLFMNFISMLYIFFFLLLKPWKAHLQHLMAFINKWHISMSEHLISIFSVSLFLIDYVGSILRKCICVEPQRSIHSLTL